MLEFSELCSPGLQVISATAKQYCEYRLELAALDGDKVVRQTVGEGNQPFRVTGLEVAADQVAYSAYQAVFVGGALNPDAGGDLCPGGLAGGPPAVRSGDGSA